MPDLLPFTQAVRFLAQKRALPTNMSSAELMDISAAVRERSLFSARNTIEAYLEDLRGEVGKILEPQTIERDGVQVNVGSDLATSRLALKQKLAEYGYVPAGEDAGTLKDFSSDARLDLVIKTNTEMAQGFGAWRRGQDAAILDEWPAQRLFRLEDRKERRDWHERAKAAAAETGSRIVLQGEGFVALKNDPVWTALSEFGTPYPPFDFNSGMWVEDVSREEAMSLGLIDANTQIAPQRGTFEMLQEVLS